MNQMLGLVECAPTFLLRGIDATKIIEKYEDDDFKFIVMETSKKNVNKKKINTEEVVTPVTKRNSKSSNPTHIEIKHVKISKKTASPSNLKVDKQSSNESVDARPQKKSPKISKSINASNENIVTNRDTSLKLGDDSSNDNDVELSTVNDSDSKSKRIIDKSEREDEKNETKNGSSVNNFIISQQRGDPTYLFKLKNGNTKMIATTNNYAIRKDAKIVSALCCQYCHCSVKNNEQCGIPVRMILDKGKMTYYLDGITCSNECALSLYLSNRNDPLYLHSESFLRNLHSQMYPGSGVLEPAPDYRLLKKYGGPLDEKEYHSKTHPFVRTANIIVPIKVQYHLQE